MVLMAGLFPIYFCVVNIRKLLRYRKLHSLQFPCPRTLFTRYSTMLPFYWTKENQILSLESVIYPKIQANTALEAACCRFTTPGSPCHFSVSVIFANRVAVHSAAHTTVGLSLSFSEESDQPPLNEILIEAFVS